METKEEQARINTEIDYIICESIDITMDELDEMPFHIVQKLRDEHKHLI